jgi:DNA/RNA-binding domain of Phe-tRNA-synthetase-like protein
VQITRASGLDGIVRLGALVIDGAANAAADPRLDGPLSAAEAAVRAHPPEESQAVRAMYRRIGLDPTKTRPSSEALLRRVRKGDALPRINTLVDVCNWCSLEFQLPYGLYDVAALVPPVALRIGVPGEHYAGIRKDVVNVGDRMTLADAEGPFGNPTSDSARTMVTVGTRTVLAVVFAPADTTDTRLARVLDRTAERLLAFAGGEATFRAVI